MLSPRTSIHEDSKKENQQKQEVEIITLPVSYHVTIIHNQINQMYGTITVYQGKDGPSTAKDDPQQALVAPKWPVGARQPQVGHIKD